MLYILVIFSSVAFYALTFARLTENIQISISKKINNCIKNSFKKLKKVLKSIGSIYYNIQVKRRKVKTSDNKGEADDSGKKEKK